MLPKCFSYLFLNHLMNRVPIYKCFGYQSTLLLLSEKYKISLFFVPFMAYENSKTLSTLFLRITFRLCSISFNFSFQDDLSKNFGIILRGFFEIMRFSSSELSKKPLLYRNQKGLKIFIYNPFIVPH